MLAELTIPTHADIGGRLTAALARLRQDDIDLLKRDANERSITHRLAIYIESEFPDWFVDCEFNRHGDGVKEIKNPTIPGVPDEVRTDDTDAVSVFPDIIVHGRTKDSNLLAIEVKKSARKRSVQDFDKRKLEAYRSELGYRFTAFVIVPTGKDHANGFNVEVLPGSIGGPVHTK